MSREACVFSVFSGDLRDWGGEWGHPMDGHPAASMWSLNASMITTPPFCAARDTGSSTRHCTKRFGPAARPHRAPPSRHGNSVLWPNSRKTVQPIAARSQLGSRHPPERALPETFCGFRDIKQRRVFSQTADHHSPRRLQSFQKRSLSVRSIGVHHETFAKPAFEQRNAPVHQPGSQFKFCAKLPRGLANSFKDLRILPADRHQSQQRHSMQPHCGCFTSQLMVTQT
jgi:hypothetical protein